MKDHPERKGRLQLIEAMFAGHSWQSAVAQSQLNVSRATAYRLRQLARDEDKAELAFLDDRHGHPYKLTEPVQAWISEFWRPPHLKLYAVGAFKLANVLVNLGITAYTERWSTLAPAG